MEKWNNRFLMGRGPLWLSGPPTISGHDSRHYWHCTTPAKMLLLLLLGPLKESDQPQAKRRRPSLLWLFQLLSLDNFHRQILSPYKFHHLINFHLHQFPQLPEPGSINGTINVSDTPPLATCCFFVLRKSNLKEESRDLMNSWLGRGRVATSFEARKPILIELSSGTKSKVVGIDLHFSKLAHIYMYIYLWFMVLTGLLIIPRVSTKLASQVRLIASQFDFIGLIKTLEPFLDTSTILTNTAV